jgi:hypothetical protein
VRVGLRARLEVIRVVAGILVHDAAIELQDAVADGIEHVAVVRDHQDRAGEALDEKGFEPRDDVRVQVVRRLVEDREVRPGDQDPREGDASPLAAAHRTNRLVGLADTELLQHLVDFVIAAPAAEALEFLPQVGELVDERRVVRAGRERRADRFVARLRGGPCGEAAFDPSARRDLRRELRLLLEKENVRASLAFDRPAVGGLEAAEALEERRLARAVHTQEPDPIAARDGDLHVGEEHLRAVGFRQRVRRKEDHGRIPYAVHASKDSLHAPRFARRKRIPRSVPWTVRTTCMQKLRSSA